MRKGTDDEDGSVEVIGEAKRAAAGRTAKGAQRPARPAMQDRIARSRDLWDDSFVENEMRRRTSTRAAPATASSPPPLPVRPAPIPSSSPASTATTAGTKHAKNASTKAQPSHAPALKPPPKQAAAGASASSQSARTRHGTSSPYMETTVVQGWKDDSGAAEVSSEVRDEREEYIVCVLGGGGAGKSSLIVRLLTGEFVDQVDPTLLDEYQGVIEFQGRKVHIHFLDTAGQEQYRVHRHDSITRSQAYLLVYDVCQPVSFEEIDVFVNEICRLRGCDSIDIPIVVAANKCDAPESRRRITSDQGRSFAAENSCRFIEVSAKSKVNLPRLIEVLLQEISYYRRHRQGSWVMVSDPNMRNPRKRYLLLERSKIFLLKKSLKDNTPVPADFSKEEGFSLLDITPAIKTGRAEGPKGEEAYIISLTYQDSEQGQIVFQWSNRADRDLWYNRIRASFESANMVE